MISYLSSFRFLLTSRPFSVVPWRFLLVLGLLFVCLPSDLYAIPRNPPPVFESEYSLPETVLPSPTWPLGTRNLAIVFFYCLFLLLASLAIYRRRNRWMLFCLSVASVGLFGFYFGGCPCPVGMLQNMVDALIVPFPSIPWTVLFLFLLPLIVSLFLGRVFCSSVCPLGAVQELTLLRPIRLPAGLEQGLGLLRYLYLGLVVFFVVTGLGYLLCRFDPYVGFFRFGGLMPVMIFSGILLVLGFFVGRPFCRFLCPYGALLGLCATVSHKTPTVTPNECTKCGLCEKACPYDAIRCPTELPTPEQRRRGPLLMLLAILMLPVLILLFGYVGSLAGPAFASWHVEVRTAQRLYVEELNLVDAFGTFPETRAVMQTGMDYPSVYRRAYDRILLFRQAGFWLGIWFGTVIGLKFIALTLRRRQTEYTVDPARCVACGRCFWYCPNQKGHRILLESGSHEISNSTETNISHSLHSDHS